MGVQEWKRAAAAKMHNFLGKRVEEEINRQSSLPLRPLSSPSFLLSSFLCLSLAFEIVMLSLQTAEIRNEMGNGVFALLPSFLGRQRGRKENVAIKI